ncbi:hypothetical protein ACYSNM_11365 [Myroides sp. LJL116]
MEEEIFQKIETWYNIKREHSDLNYLTIDEFRQKIQFKKAAELNLPIKLEYSKLISIKRPCAKL